MAIKINGSTVIDDSQNGTLTGYQSVTGNVTGGNINTAGVVSSGGNVQAGNLRTAGLISATGTITGANITGANLLTGGLISATATITGGNIATGGTVSATGNITGGNILGGANVNATTHTGTTASLSGNIDGGNLRTGGVVTATGTITGGNLATGGTISATGNITGGNILGGANVNATTHTGTTVSVSGNIDGGNLRTGGTLSATGNIIGANKLLVGLNSTTLTNPVGVFTGAGATYDQVALINSTGTGSADIITYGNNGDDTNAWADIGFTGNAFNDTNYTITGINDGYVFVQGNSSYGGNLVMATGNLGTTRDIVFSFGFLAANEFLRFKRSTNTILPYANITANLGSSTNYFNNLYSANHYGTLASLSGNIDAGNLRTGGLVTSTGTVTGGNIATGGTVSATATITGGNIATAGTVSSGGNITGANVLTGGLISATGTVNSGSNINATNWVNAANVSASGNVLIAGYISAVGNLYVANVVSSGNLVVDDPLVYFNAGASYPYNYQIGFYSDFTGGAGNTYQHTGLIRDYTDNVWKLASNLPEPSGTSVSFTNAIYDPIKTGNITSTGLVSASGTITGTTLTGTILTGTISTAAQPNVTSVGTLTSLNSGAISSSGNITGANLLTGGLISATGNVTGSYIFGNGSQLTGLSASKIFNGTSEANIVSSGGNLAVSIGGSSNVAVFATTGEYVTGVVSATGTITGGNLATGGTISATGNITGGNILGGANVNATTHTGTSVSVSGTITGASLAGTITTASQTNITAVGTLTSLNSGTISSSGTVTGTTLIGSVLTGTLSTAAQTNITSLGTLSSLNSGAISSSGTVTGTALVSTIATGTAPLTVTSTTKVTNLNVEQVDGYHAAEAGTVSTIVVRDSSGYANVAGLINSGSNGVGNIGSSTTYFNTVFAKATSAQYADLAEKYVGDRAYAPGTVVSFGGTAEVTLSTVDSDRRIAGVVSTNPSYIMNGTLEGETVVTVALTGRVPVSVVGAINKGDMMVSAGNGVARAETNPALGTVIGKALEDFTGEAGVIEVVVGRL